MGRTSDRLKRNGHPGWGVQMEGGTWLCAVHGLYEVDDAFYATVMDTKEEAERLLQDYIIETKNIGMWKGKPTEHFDPNRPVPKGKTSPAWEPMCQMLIFDVERLKLANKISPSTLFDIQMSLEDAINTIQGAVKDLNQDKEDE